MRKEYLPQLSKKVDYVYGLVNHVVSHQSIELIELAYPNKDGEPDYDVFGELHYLRASAKDLSIVCDKLVDQLSVLIGDIDQYEYE